MPDGREYILAYYDEDDYEDDEDYFNNWRDPGDDLPPLRLTIPIRDYIIDADYADAKLAELYATDPLQHAWLADVDPALPAWLAAAVLAHADDAAPSPARTADGCPMARAISP